jgi:hypothetical protein
MTTVMNVAIETVNTVVETALGTINRISSITLEQLQATGQLTAKYNVSGFRSTPPFLRHPAESDWEEPRYQDSGPAAAHSFRSHFGTASGL